MSDAQQLEQAIAALETQRAILGDAVVDAALAALRDRLAALRPPDLPPDQERRQVTILFADVSGFTALSETMDAEEVGDLLNELWLRLDRAVTTWGGRVDKHIGDAIMAVWSTGATQEDDPERAVRAALALQDEVQRFATEGHPPIRMHIGINTGQVLIGAVGTTHEMTVMGDAVNVASRLEGAAPRGGILMTHDTYRHVRGVFDVEPQPPLTVKGKSKPLLTYLVKRAKPRPFRTVTRGVSGIETHTVGRQMELDHLRTAYVDVFEHQAVAWAQLVGEPGVGKSRLLEDMAEWMDLRPRPFRLFRGRAFAGDDRQPFALIRRLWFDRFQIAEDAPLDEAEASWTAGFTTLRGAPDDEAAHALGLLVGMPFAASPYIGAMRDDPLQVKGRAFVVSRDLFETVRRDRPVVVLLEDLHWADASSWEYLTQVFLAAASQNLPHGLIVFASARPEWSPPASLLDDPHYRPLDLAPLTDEATRELVREMLRGVESVPPEAVSLVAERAEGVPYYAEELINWFIDQGIIDQSSAPWRFAADRLRESPLPTTLQHLLLTRLSTLSDTGRAALQRGAIFGRDFWADGVAALGIPGANAILTALQPRGFVVPQPEARLMGESEWSFYHALLREVTYESILRRERARLHRTAAAWLEDQARRAARLDEFAGLLAEHYEHAGEPAVAAQWYARAGERAMAQGAPREARGFLDRALDMASGPDVELRWRVLLCRVEALDLIAERDAQASDVASLIRLATEMGDDQHLAEAYFRQERYATALGDPHVQRPAADQAIASAHRAGDLSLEARALASKVVWQTRQGEVAAARETTEAALARARESDDEATEAFVLIRAGSHYSEVGDLAQAVTLFGQAADVAARLGDRRSEAQARGNLGYNYVLLGLYALARETLERAQTLTAAIGERRMRAYHLLNLGLAAVQSRDRVAAHAPLDEALAELTATGDAFGQAAGRLYLGLALEQTGDTTEAASRFAEAEATFRELGIAGFALTALAGQARCALAEGQLDLARRHAATVWDALQASGSAGVEFPILAYQTCGQVFNAISDGEPARAAAGAGYRELIAAASKISEDAWRRSFLENVPEHRALITLWQRLAVADGERA